jgi:hypothetical protein
MAFKNSCFFSYRHRPDRDYRVCIDDLYESLAGEISLWLTGQGIFRDSKRMQGGDLLDPTIGEELCQSVCMVMIYIPPYFDETESYCAREFRGMQRLEQQRLEQLVGPAKNHGLIIPIVCRGWDVFPRELRNNRIVYNFEPFLMQKDRISKHREGKVRLKEIAQYIFKRCTELQAIGSDACKDCSRFTLPSADEVVPWVREVQATKSLFPGRTA